MMNRIQRVSLIFRILFQAGMCVLPVLMIWFWIQAPSPLFNRAGFTVSFIEHSVYIPHMLTATQKLYGFLISCIPSGMTLLTLFFLVKLFRNLEKGTVFDLQNVGYTRKIGFVMLIGQILHLPYQALMTFTMTFHNPPGHRVIQVGVVSWNIGILATAVIIILISWILAEAYELQKDKLLTI